MTTYSLERVFSSSIEGLRLYFASNSCKLPHREANTKLVLELGNRNVKAMEMEEDSKESDVPFNLMHLPVEMIDNILSYLTYDQVSKLREVNRKMNTICCRRLNNGFLQVEMFHSKCMKSVKSMLPRRESERKTHPLARHSDILISVETRLSMLSMTFTKYIESNQCCFFPGKVLDEVFKVLYKVAASLAELEAHRRHEKPVTHTPTLLPRPHEFLQEYRDISSMAMEYFDERILPAIKEKMKLDNSQVYFYKFKTCNLRTSQANTANAVTRAVSVPQPSLSTSSQSGPNCRLVKLLRVTNRNCKITDRIVALMDKKIKILSSKLKFQTSYMQRKLFSQKKTILSLQKELEETKSTMNVMRKDINLMKGLTKDCGDSLLVDQPGSSHANLSITMASSVTIPAQPHRTSAKGQKRNHPPEDDGSQEINVKKHKNESNTG